MSVSAKFYCVFPQVTKTWQKVACGTIGLAAFGSGFYVFSKALSAGLDRVDAHAATSNINAKINEACENPTVDAFFKSKITEKVVLSTTSVTCGVLSILMAKQTITDPWAFLKPCAEEFKLFKQAIAGTRCCDIIRQTARFALLGPGAAFFIAPLTIIAPVSSVLGAFLAVEIGHHAVTGKSLFYK